MGRFIKITLDDKTRAALEAGHRRDQSHTFRQRCQIVLLKTQGRKSKEIAAIFGCGEKSVNDWLHRYLCEGIEGLRTKPGRGRPGILSTATDAARVRQAVTEHRQRISQAKAALEEDLGKEFSQRTLVRFLKNLTADISV
ncbi:MAG: helix-turn-helix domain-containing protein [Pyrinomonadaceae bacterium]